METAFILFQTSLVPLATTRNAREGLVRPQKNSGAAATTTPDEAKLRISVAGEGGCAERAHRWHRSSSPGSENRKT